ncbi:hypothetical protein DFS34DRAFT_372981 [Phlyctochytrium arcticum]|nr:hypothetical protein DFS34DRAFT_372981 [Phlyctochytrium arcticum]
MSDAGSEAEFQETGPNIGTYEGERNDALERHGQGKSIFPNGDTYTGTYLAGKRNGFGTYRFKASGARYKGEYKDHMRNGNGEMIYPDGSQYKGTWGAGGKRHGEGTYTYVNGDTYKGTWVEDKKHGSGVYTFASTGSKLEANFLAGEPSGPGKVVHADHTLHAPFGAGGQPELPATITFAATGWTGPVRDQSWLGARAVTTGGDRDD